jgi:glutamine synthetase
VPASDADNLRIEHRLAGADANPYLVTAWILAGMLRGLELKLEPPAVLTGNAYRQQDGQEGDPLPTNWPAALERFTNSSFAAEAFGDKFAKLFVAVKRAEMEEFNSHVSALEVARYLGPL